MTGGGSNGTIKTQRYFYITACEDPHEHDLQHFEAKDPTCVKEGNIEYWYCADCGKYFSDEAAGTEITKEETILAATDEHDWSEWVAGEGENCETGGTLRRSCSICGKTEEQTFSAGSHMLEYVERVPSTCIEAGVMAHWHCERCGKNYADKNAEELLEDVSLPLGAHNIVDGKCTVCGKSEEQLVPECTHHLTHVDEIPSTCIQTGTREHWHCEICGNNYADENAEELLFDLALSLGAHTLEYVEEVPSTCVEAGSMAHWHCEICGKSYADEQGADELIDVAIEKLAHDAEFIERKEETCGEDGYEAHWMCKMCEGIFFDEECSLVVDMEEIIIPKTNDHVLPEEWVMTKEPTRTEMGLKVKQCENCLYQLTQDVDTIDYDYTEGLNYELNDEKTGYIVRYDSTQHPIIVNSTIAPHAVFEGLPVVGIEEITESQEDMLNIQKIIIPETVEFIDSFYEDMIYLSIFDVVDTNPYFSSADGVLFNRDKTELIYFPNAKIMYEYDVPDTVKKIGDGAFKHAKITILNCNEGLEEIGSSMIAGNQDIETINLPTTLKLIGGGAFASRILKRINGLPSSIEYVGSALSYTEEDCYNYTLYKGGIYLGNEENPYLILTDARWYNSEIIVHPSTKIISGGVGSSSGTDYTFIIPDNVTASGSLFGGNSVDKIHIGKNVKFTVDNPFSNVLGLREITVSVDNPYYTAIDGVLYSKDMKTLLCYPVAKENISYTIEDGCEKIAEYAFNFSMSRNQTLEEVVMPDSVEEIGQYAFKYQKALKSVRLSNGIRFIGEGAFSYCDLMSEVAILNTSGESITIGEKAFEYSGLEKITMSDNVVVIGGGAFRSCSNLTSVTIPNGIINIGNDTFYGCRSLNSVSFPDSVVMIGERAFYYCPELTAITIPNSVTSIGAQAFARCAALKIINISDKITKIFRSAFNGCGQIEEIHIDKLSAWCTIDFEDSYSNPLYYGAALYVDGEIVTDFEVPEGITSIGKYAFYKYGQLAHITIPKGVTNIGEYAFYECSSLESIYIPSSVVDIAENAFGICGELESIIVEKGNTRYSSDGNCLVDIVNKTLMLGCNNSVIPDNGSITTIADRAFNKCSRLESIIIPEGVVNIGEYAFKGCSSLTSIIIPDSLESIPASVFDDYSIIAQIENGISYLGKWVVDCETLLTQVVLRDDTVGIAAYAFQDCELLTNVKIPDSVTSIGDYAFRGCSSLISISIPDSVTSIGSYAFSDCDSLSSIAIPNSVINMDYALGGCSAKIIWGDNVQFSNIEKQFRGYESNEIIVPNSVTSIGDYAFSDCSSLTSIVIPDSVTSIGRAAFSGCSSLTSITIPDSVTSIGSSAFSGCSSLTSITIPDSVTSIGGSAFSRCSSLTSITIPDSVTSIGGSAFSRCSSLTSIVIPDSVTSIGDYAFSSCKSLKSVTIQARAVSIGNYAFSGCDSLESATLNGVICIGDSAFSECGNLSKVRLSRGLKSIGKEAFLLCSKLTSITIPISVINIGAEAFKVYFQDPIKINYSGTKTQWKNIVKGGDLWDYSEGYQVACTDGVLIK